MIEIAKQQFLWHTHQTLVEHTRFADTKAAFAGAVASILIRALYEARAYLPMSQLSPYQWPFSTWLAALGGLLLFASVALAIWTVLPRLHSSQSKGFIYWESIANYGHVEPLQTSFQGQSVQTLSDHLLHNIFDLSTKVCTPKFRTAYYCILALCAGGLLALAALVLSPPLR